MDIDANAIRYSNSWLGLMSSKDLLRPPLRFERELSRVYWGAIQAGDLGAGRVIWGCDLKDHYTENLRDRECLRFFLFAARTVIESGRGMNS